MDIMQAFRYVFDSEDWIKKVLTGMLINLVPIFGLANMGYGIEVLNNVAKNEPDPLPYWEDIGDKFMQGLIAGIAGFIYYLVPGLIVACLTVVPTIAIGAAGLDEDAMGIVASAVSICGGLIGLVLFLAVGLVYMAGLIRYATVAPEFGTFFQISDNLALFRENTNLFIKTLLFMILVGLIIDFAAPIVLVISVITICGPFIILLALPVYVQLIVMHLIGQMTRELNLEGAAQAPAV